MKIVITRHAQERIQQRGLLESDTFTNALKQIQKDATSRSHLLKASKPIKDSVEDLMVYSYEDIRMIYTMKDDMAILISVYKQD